MKFHGILIRLASVSTLFFLLFSTSVFSSQSMPPSSDTEQWKAVENGLGRSANWQWSCCHQRRLRIAGQRGQRRYRGVARKWNSGHSHSHSHA